MDRQPTGVMIDADGVGIVRRQHRQIGDVFPRTIIKFSDNGNINGLIDVVDQYIGRCNVNLAKLPTLQSFPTAGYPFFQRRVGG